MSDWTSAVTVEIHGAEIEMMVVGTPVRGQPSVGESNGWHMDDAHLCWPDGTPLDMNTLHMIGDKQHRHAINEACDKLRAEGP